MIGVTCLGRRQVAKGLKVEGERALLFGNSVSKEEARTSELGAKVRAGCVWESQHGVHVVGTESLGGWGSTGR